MFIVLADGSWNDTEGAYLIESFDWPVPNEATPEEVVDYADRNGVPLNNVLNGAGYEV